MISIYANRELGLTDYIADGPSDIKNFRLSKLSPGCRLFVISTSKLYMLNGSREWIEIRNSFGSGSGGGDEGISPAPNYFDGGSIDGTDPIN